MENSLQIQLIAWIYRGIIPDSGFPRPSAQIDPIVTLSPGGLVRDTLQWEIREARVSEAPRHHADGSLWKRPAGYRLCDLVAVAELVEITVPNAFPHPASHVVWQLTFMAAYRALILRSKTPAKGLCEAQKL